MREIRQTIADTISPRLAKTKQTILKDMYFDRFPKPAPRAKNTKSDDSLSLLSTSDSLAASSECEILSLLPEQIATESRIHYSQILPQKNSKTDAINENISMFIDYWKLQKDYSEANYSVFEASLYKITKILARNWEAIKFQHADALANSFVFLVCQDSGVKLKILMDAFISVCKKKKISIIRKSLAFALVKRLVREG